MKRTTLSQEDTFSEQVRYDENVAHNGYCRVRGCTAKIHSYHHRIPNTITNREKYPLFIQSPLNCAGLCVDHHEGHATAGVDVTDREAEVYETFLHKGCNGKE